MKRGRPAYPDILTPREWEVLELLRQDLTNQEIADRLGISERGARFHVSEILSKLGVDSRKDAAAWRKHPRVWSYYPFSWIGGISLKKQITFTSLVFLALLSGIGMAATGHQWWRTGSLASVSSDPVGASQTLDLCERDDVQCIPSETGYAASLASAAENVSFIPLSLPQLPPGFEPTEMRQFSANQAIKSFGSDQIVIEYRDSDRQELTVSQGYLVPYVRLFALAPPRYKGMIETQDYMIYWVRGGYDVPICCDGFGLPFSAEWRDEDRLSVFAIAQTLGEQAVTITERTTKPPEPGLPHGKFALSAAPLTEAGNHQGRKILSTEIFFALSSTSLNLDELERLLVSTLAQ